MAERHYVLPVSVEGLSALGKILIEHSEFAAARDILEAALPHVCVFTNSVSSIIDVCAGPRNTLCYADRSAVRIGWRGQRWYRWI